MRRPSAAQLPVGRIGSVHGPAGVGGGVGVPGPHALQDAKHASLPAQSALAVHGVWQRASASVQLVPQKQSSHESTADHVVTSKTARSIRGE